MGCKPNPWEAGADFKQYVRGVADGAKPQEPSTLHPDALQGQSNPATNGEAVTQ
jgi:hypothetical protein